MEAIDSLRSSSIDRTEAPRAKGQDQVLKNKRADPEVKGESAPAARAENIVSREDVQKAAKELRDALQSLEGDFSVTVDDDTGRMVVRVTDNRTGDVVRQIPPEELLKVNRSVAQIVGLLLDSEA